MNTPATGFQTRSVTRVLILAVTVGLLPACSPVLVTPYDAVLVERTEAIFAEASQLIGDGYTSSPLTDAERARIRPATSSAGHYAKFEPRYDALIASVDGMILRSMAGSGEVDRVGQSLEQKIEDLIETSLPSSCPELSAEFAALTTSLTVKNYVDLKCLFIGWKDQHASTEVTLGTMILKKANWESRRGALFSAVLAIQRAELSKKQ